MKYIYRFIIGILAIVILLCSGCSHGQSILYSNEYVFGQDQQISYYGNTGLTDPAMADSESGYYFMNGQFSQFLFYKDKATGETAPLCNKPECLHNDNTCNAYLGRIKALMHYAGKNYYLTDGPFNPTADGSENDMFCEISLDGSAHKELLTFPESVYLITIHRGYVYYATTDYGTIPGKEDETQTTMCFYRLSVNRLNSEPELLYNVQGIDASISSLKCYGNYIYFHQSMYADATRENYTGQTNRYNIMNGTIDVVLDKNYTLYTIFNGKLGLINREGTYLCDLDGQHIEKVSDQYGILSSSGNYLLIDTLNNRNVLRSEAPRTILAIDVNGNFTSSIALDSSQYRSTPVGIVDNKYLIPSYSQETQCMAIYQIPVGKIADGTGQPEVFFEYTGQ